MNLSIQVLDGPLQGQLFVLKPGLTIGRSQGDLAIRDKKASSQHALVHFVPAQSPESNPKWEIEDLKSSNGIWLGERKAQRFELTEGLEFRIGSTRFRIVTQGSRPTPQWNEILTAEIQGLPQGHPPLLVAQVSPFSPFLVLRFRQGPHAGETVVCGYGPRRVGSDVLDLELMDLLAPALAFEIRPTLKGADFFTPLPDLVIYNGQHISACAIETGDLVQVGKTVIEFSFSESPQEDFL